MVATFVAFVSEILGLIPHIIDFWPDKSCSVGTTKLFFWRVCVCHNIVKLALQFCVCRAKVHSWRTGVETDDGKFQMSKKKFEATNLELWQEPPTMIVHSASPFPTHLNLNLVMAFSRGGMVSTWSSLASRCVFLTFCLKPERFFLPCRLACGAA